MVLSGFAFALIISQPQAFPAYIYIYFFSALWCGVRLWGDKRAPRTGVDLPLVLCVPEPLMFAALYAVVHVFQCLGGA